MIDPLDSIPLIIEGTTGNDLLAGGALNDSVNGDDGNDFLIGHSHDVAYGENDGEWDILAGGDGFDGYGWSGFGTSWTDGMQYVFGVGNVADNNFNYSLFNTVDTIYDSDGDGYIIHSSDQWGDLDLTSSIWSVFDGPDNVVYDFQTTGTVYELSDLWMYTYIEELEDWDYTFVSVWELGLENQILATMHSGDLYMFTWDHDYVEDEVTYTPIGMIEDYTMGPSQYVAGDLYMFIG